jgi:hypothetical protein
MGRHEQDLLMLQLDSGAGDRGSAWELVLVRDLNPWPAVSRRFKSRAAAGL